MHKFIFILFLTNLVSVLGKTPDYSVEDLNSSLLENANAIVRYESTDFRIKDYDKGAAQKTIAITVLNENGLKYGTFSKHHNSFVKYNWLAAKIYNSKGKVVKKVNQQDFVDISDIDSYELYSDSRIMYYEPEYNSYPFTIEYSFKIDFDKGLSRYPPWYPITGYNLSVEKSEYKVTVPQHVNVKFKKRDDNSVIVFNESQENEYKTYEWKLNHFLAITPEPYSPSIKYLTPNVELAPEKFRIKSIEGTAATWEEFGEWVWQLLVDKNNFTEEDTTAIKSIVKGCSNDIDKVQKLYKHMQDNMRYVYVEQSAIGGWEPLDAKTVAENSYGDCKALTNYLRCALDVVGVKSYYTIVKAGSYSRDIDVDFPSNQFNHVILYVPLKKDTVWLECTRQRFPFGYLGSFTENRHALIITENGRMIKKTPNYNKALQKINLNANISIDDAGGGYADINTTSYGIAAEYGYKITSLSNKEKEKLLYSTIGIDNIRIDNFVYSIHESSYPILTNDIALTFNNYTRLSSDLIILPLHPFSNKKFPRRIRNRKSSVYISREIYTIDTISFSLSESYQIIEVPTDKNITTEFGHYRFKTETQNNKIEVIRELYIPKGEYPAEKYNDYYKFRETISKTDNSKAILKKL